MEKSNAVPVEKVYLVAEHRLLRETLVRLLCKRADIRVVGETRHADCTCDLITASGCHVLLLDSLTAAHTVELLDALYEKAPEIKTVVFGMDDDPQVFLKAVRLGVSGYLSKEASAVEIIAAVRAVAQGEAVCPPKLCMALFHQAACEFRKHPVITDREARIKFGLTHRQSQLVALVANGLSNKEIAATLNLSEFTVKSHLRRIMKQVKAESRFEAVDLIRGTGTRLDIQQ
jgi:DNA-binding NarL/FixJ family response regulator